MPLPKVNAPIFTTTLPSTKEKISFRPFLVKEERNLLIAIEGASREEITAAVINVLQSCILTETIDITKIASFDMEYLFLQVRAKSVGEVIDFKFRHIDGKNSKGEECDHIENLQVNLEEVQVQFDPNHTNKIQVTDDIGVVMRYPSLSDSLKESETNTDKSYDMIIGCIDKVWDGDEVFDDFTYEEAEEFLNSLETHQLKKISAFFNTMPVLSHNIKYKCGGCGSDENIILSGLENFFT